MTNASGPSTIATDMHPIASRAGFTIIETIITIGIFGIIAATTLPFLGNVRERQTLDAEMNSVIQAIRRAQHRSMSNTDNTVWGVHVTGTGYTLYGGPSFLGRNPLLDEVRTFDDVYTLTGSGYVFFESLDGLPVSPAHFVLRHHATGTGIITVTSAGMALSQFIPLGTE